MGMENMDQNTNHKSMNQKNGKRMIINQAIGRKDILIHTKEITMDRTYCIKIGRKMMENTDQNTQNLAKIKKSIHQNMMQRITKTIHPKNITKKMSQKIQKKIIKLLANMAEHIQCVK